MEFLTDYGLFLAKTITVVIASLAIMAGVLGLSMRASGRTKDHLEIKHLNRHYQQLANTLQAVMLPRKKFKQLLKRLKKQHKTKVTEGTVKGQRVFVVNFHGDVRGSAVAALREEITAILTVAEAGDEVLVRLESAGGMVHAYGLAASQLLRIRDKPLKLTVAVDKVAASGGYLMACVADRIIAAPFAVVGSIGVVAQFPNFNRLLKKHDIDFEQFTAGEYKRTVTVFGDNTDNVRNKFREELEEVHGLFKEFVVSHRNILDMSRVATGEHWYGTQALELKLIDELRTSDDYLMQASQDADLFEVKYIGKKPLMAKLTSSVSQALEQRLFGSQGTNL